MRKHGGPPSRRDKHVTLAAISPPGVARGRFVGGQKSGLAGCKPPPLFTRGASSCSSQGRRQGEPWGASPRPSAPTYLPTCLSFPPVQTCVAPCPPRHQAPGTRSSPSLHLDTLPHKQPRIQWRHASTNVAFQHHMPQSPEDQCFSCGAVPLSLSCTHFLPHQLTGGTTQWCTAQ